MYCCNTNSKKSRGYTSIPLEDLSITTVFKAGGMGYVCSHKT